MKDKNNASTVRITFHRSGPKFVWVFLKAWVLGVGVDIDNDPQLIQITHQE